MFRKVLIANRGAVASRIARALGQLGVGSVAVASAADGDALWLEQAGEAQILDGHTPAETYLNIDALLAIARRTGCDAVHPGYGFLAENPAFADATRAAGLGFVGPASHWLEVMGHKTRARALMAEQGLPVRAGSGLLDDLQAAGAAASQLGYPLLLKPAAGGGGIGMVEVADEAALRAAWEQTRGLAMSAFGSGDLYLEARIDRPRHVEFQVLADQHGQTLHLFERDCSVQRRHQKLIEEAPAPGLERAVLDDLAAASATALGKLGYDHIGTVETLRGADGAYGFLEVNTRLQVEHAVTEMVTGVDIVQAQIRLAAGATLATVVTGTPQLDGFAVEARVCAEDPRQFLPSPGVLRVFRPPRMSAVRVETGYREGQRVPPFYDSLIAKVIAWGPTRPKAIGRLAVALRAFEVTGIEHNIPALLAVLGRDDFIAGEVHTGLLRAARPT